jgi:hypothetical protein
MEHKEPKTQVEKETRTGTEITTVPIKALK